MLRFRTQRHKIKPQKRRMKFILSFSKFNPFCRLIIRLITNLIRRIWSLKCSVLNLICFVLNFEWSVWYLKCSIRDKGYLYLSFECSIRCFECSVWSMEWSVSSLKWNDSNLIWNVLSLICFDSSLECFVWNSIYRTLASKCPVFNSISGYISRSNNVSPLSRRGGLSIWMKHE